MLKPLFLLVFTSAFLIPQEIYAQKVGEKAPSVKGNRWLNTSAPPKWKYLSGRLILIYKFTVKLTCPPCEGMIQRLNELQFQYRKRGLVIIAVCADLDDAGEITEYIETHGMRVPVLILGAPDYKTTTVPHAWLVDPSGEIAWVDTASKLSSDQIEELLKDARMIPRFKVPDAIKKAHKHVESQSIGKAMAELESYLEKPKSKKVARKAKRALKAMKSFAKAELDAVDKFAGDGDYAEGIEILERISRAYKKTEPGDKATEKLKAWKRDRAIKLELKAANLLEKAFQLILGDEKSKAHAIALVRKLAKSKKYEGTRTQKRAIVLLKDWD